MKKVISIGLVTLLGCYTLAYMLVAVTSWWQAENDLSKRLLVYRSVDSLVEFQISLANNLELNDITRTTSDGFTYNGHYYSVVSVELHGDQLSIVGLELKSHSLWQDDLLSFLNEHIHEASQPQQKANQFLKLLLKEYSPAQQAVFSFIPPHWHEAIRIPNRPCLLLARALPVHSPPPEV
ncbi:MULTISPECIES: hypothetical protein [unclassified Spirosoma]|uniref:hypothetical protein n=1 Tax=unclassified Spirosoma TaxID=2621999 RepID=UPI00096741C1|nr:MULTISPECIES: hypothetical protein [unclassified Spirosoma]MBN8824211.1 hypothetical protein [Spirosoma sp.]OJW78945.1 MAG: hypothetical protein BGO59_10795 [Spirosoma sp. 48-14]